MREEKHGKTKHNRKKTRRTPNHVAVLMVVALLCFAGQPLAQAASVKQQGLILNTLAYTIPDKGPLTAKIVNNLAYKTHIHASRLDSNPRYGFLTFTDGKAPSEEGSLSNIALGDLTGAPQPSAAFVINSWRGGNALEQHLCVITRRDGAYHVTQALLDLVAVDVRSVAIRDKEIVVSILYPGPGEPSCCPTRQGTLGFKLIDDTFVPTRTVAFPKAW